MFAICAHQRLYLRQTSPAIGSGLACTQHVSNGHPPATLAAQMSCGPESVTNSGSSRTTLQLGHSVGSRSRSRSRNFIRRQNWRRYCRFLARTVAAGSPAHQGFVAWAADHGAAVTRQEVVPQARPEARLVARLPTACHQAEYYTPAAARRLTAPMPQFLRLMTDDRTCACCCTCQCLSC